MRRLFPCLFVCIIPFCAAAQFSDSLTHLARFAATGNINRTNTATSYLFTNEARFSIKKPTTTLNTAASWVYGELGNKRTNNDFTATLDFNLYKREGKFYYWGLGNYATSVSLNINHQLQAGLGVAYNFVNTPTAWLNLSDGLLFETNSLALNDSVNTHYQTVRNSARLSYRFVIKNIITLNGTNFLQNSLTNSSDYIIRTSNSASIKLNKWLSFVTSVTYNQLRRTRRENLLFTYGLTAEKYF